MSSSENMNSSFLILQQQAALMKSENPNAAVASTSTSSSTSVPASTNEQVPIYVPNVSILPPTSAPPSTPSTVSTGSAVTMDHCNINGGFHDGMMDVVCDNDEDYIDDASELNTLEGAAFQSRMEPDKMGPEELEAFSDILEQHSLIPIYLYVRNSILKYWYTRPKTQLLLEEIFRRLEPPFNSDHVFVSRVFYFLERFGYINFGVFHIEQQLVLSTKPKIIVIGAGIAGLTAARQLHYFGFDVFVLESRNRIGGRVCTYKQGKHIADVGAIVICGLGGNPLRVLEKQIPMKMKRINQKCPLHLNNQVVDKTKDEILEQVFNNLLEGTSILSHRMKFNQIGGKPVSLGEALDVVIELQERDVKQRYIKHLNDIAVLEGKLTENLNQLKTLQDCILALYDKHKDYMSSSSKTQRSVKQEYAFRVNRYQLTQGVEKHTRIKDNVKKIQGKIKELEAHDVARQYISPEERRILDWHFANLEYATATPMQALSLQHWDQDDAYEFTGPQICIKNGFSCIPYALAEGIEVKLNSVVRSVKMVQNGVEVQTVNIDKYNHQFDSKGLAKRMAHAPVTTFFADAVLCTSPLGVLKNSVRPKNPENDEDVNPNQIDFQPALPEYKAQAIQRLGYGNLNKVVLIFDQYFWDKNNHLFGHVGSSAETRGELFLYWSLYKQPVLISYIAGSAADTLEKMPDEVIKEKCMTILRGMYPAVQFALKSYYVTRWKSDPWSQGAYSFVAKEATGDDYDLLAEPVSFPEGQPGSVPRLFFAGEHTIRNYPATVHGALLSGAREATRIANQFLGVPYQLKK